MFAVCRKHFWIVNDGPLKSRPRKHCVDSNRPTSAKAKYLTGKRRFQGDLTASNAMPLRANSQSHDGLMDAVFGNVSLQHLLCGKEIRKDRKRQVQLAKDLKRSTNVFNLHQSASV